MTRDDTIAAITTGHGGAIAVIRISGDKAIETADRIFHAASGKKLESQKGFTIHYGTISENDEIIDDVLVSIFRAPLSYTGEDMIEISCHASKFIQQKILQLCISQGLRMADAGEFTMRAFMNGKMDLSQAEAVADIIASDTKAAHMLASNQMRGNYSEEFRTLRSQLIELVSLLELELDFSEEDVEFADRTKLLSLIELIENRIDTLISSFSLGNIIKNGIPVAIVGAPNTGKSTLLNTILKEDKALVSDIAGTTRDIIEDTTNIGGIEFRFIDTAGIRKTEDILENMGIERTMDKMAKASIVLFVTDALQNVNDIIQEVLKLNFTKEQSLCIILNKSDLLNSDELNNKISVLKNNVINSINNIQRIDVIGLSAKHKININSLTDFLSRQVDLNSLESQTIIFNTRHYEALQQASSSIKRAHEGLENGLSGDLLSQDIREVLLHLGTITGEITSDDILSSIFSKFCIGK